MPAHRRRTAPAVVREADRVDSRLADQRWPELDGPPRVTLLVPVGSVEQHGPHLPLDTDTGCSPRWSTPWPRPHSNSRRAVGPACDHCGMGTPREGLAWLRDAAESGELAEFCRERHIRALTVFGSTGRGESSPRDLDIGVISEYDADFDIFAVVADLMGLLSLNEVDVVHLNRGGPVIRERALGPDSIWLYESEPGVLANAQMAAMTERMETAPLRWLDLELLAQ